MKLAFLSLFFPCLLFAQSGSLVGGVSVNVGNGAGGTVVPVVASGGGATPDIVQIKSFNSSQLQSGHPNPWLNGGGIFYIPLNDPTSAGTTLILGLSAQCPSTGSFVVGDGNNNWSQETYGFSSPWAIWNFVASNSAAGVTGLYLTNNGGSNLTNFEGFVAEVTHVAASNPVDGTNTFHATGSGTISAGSITPSQAGDFIIQYGVRTDASAPTSWTAGSQANIAWKLLYADIPSALQCSFQQWGVDSATAAINPQVTVTPNADYLSSCLALKADSNQGPTPASWRIYSQQEWSFAAGTPLTNAFQVPMGSNVNLIVQSISGAAGWYCTNVTDNLGNTWSQSKFGAAQYVTGASDIWYASNAVCAPLMWVTNYWKNTSNLHGTSKTYGFTGADPQPYDFAIGETNSYQDPAGANVGHIFFNSPILFQPSVSNEYVIINEEHSFNTATNVVGSSSGMQSDTVWWKGNNQDGPSYLDQNNGWGHFKSSGNVPFITTWYFTNQAESLGDSTTIAAGFIPAGGVDGGTNIALIQHGFTKANNVNVSYVCKRPNLVGDTLIMMTQNPAGRTLTPGDTAGNTWTAALAASSDTFGNETAIFIATNVVASANNTITNHMSGASSFNNIQILEISGLAKNHPWDQVVKANTSSATPSSGNATTTFINEVLVGWFEDAAGGGTYSPKAGWAMVDYSANTMATQIGIGATTGTYSAVTTCDASTTGSQTILTLHQ